MHKTAMKVKFSEDPIKDVNDLVMNLNDKNKEDYGLYLMRTNYKRVKPHSKYTTEGTRPRSPNIPYSNLNEQAIYSNPQNASSAFHHAEGSFKPAKDRFYVERHGDTVTEHLIRGLPRSQPYCYITKDARTNYPPKEYATNGYGGYPPWGEADVGFRTRSHYEAEPVERFVNIDMYKRPLTNQPGRIIFDYGRPNNGYYLQRNQYDNTWFNSNLTLNKTNILESVGAKTEADYKRRDELQKTLVRSKTLDWPFASEYVERFTLASSNLK